MKAKSWILVIVAALLLILGLASRRQSQERLKEVNWEELSKPFSGKEEVLESGNSSQRIAVLKVEGTIADTGDGSSLQGTGYRHQEVLDQIADLKEDDSVKALLLVVDSPGGTTYHSQELYRALNDLKDDRQLPIYVSMGSMAASGGYMISMAGDKIFADNNTTTGSIGVIMSSLNVKDFMDEHGFKMEVYKSGDQKDMGSPFKDASDEEKKIFDGLIKESYDEFVRIVADGRGMDEDQVRKLADGRVYSGKQAKDNGLIDEMGYQADALAALKKDQSLEEAEVVDVTPKASEMDSILGLFSKSLDLKSVIPNWDTLQGQALHQNTPQAYYLYGGV